MRNGHYPRLSQNFDRRGLGELSKLSDCRRLHVPPSTESDKLERNSHALADPEVGCQVGATQIIKLIRSNRE